MPKYDNYSAITNFQDTDLIGVSRSPYTPGTFFILTAATLNNLMTSFIRSKFVVAAASVANFTATYNNGSSGLGATLTNSGAQSTFSVEAYVAAVGDRILVKNQTTGSQNGIYDVTNAGSGVSNWVLTRSADFDIAAKMILGTCVFSLNSVTNALTQWIFTTVGAITVGTTALTFQKIP